MQQNSNVSKLVEKSIPKTIIGAIPLVAHAIGERDHKKPQCCLRPKTIPADDFCRQCWFIRK